MANLRTWENEWLLTRLLPEGTEEFKKQIGAAMDLVDFEYRKQKIIEYLQEQDLKKTLLDLAAKLG